MPKYVRQGEKHGEIKIITSVHIHHICGHVSILYCCKWPLVQQIVTAANCEKKCIFFPRYFYFLVILQEWQAECIPPTTKPCVHMQCQIIFFCLKTLSGILRFWVWRSSLAVRAGRWWRRQRLCDVIEKVQGKAPSYEKNHPLLSGP